MKVLPIKSEETYSWILHKHYAKRLPSISYAFGLYENNELRGIVTFGMPASNSLCEGVCGVENKHLVLELNRLCLQENTKNEASFLVSNAIKLLPKPRIIVSYADTAQGHVGYVYQATNFLFTGTTKERTDMDAGDGKHSRHGTDPTIRKFRSAKHRYIYIHGSKTQKAKLLKELNYEIQQYPKGEIKRYDSGAKVITQQLLFG
jgi:predicted ATP-dependent Lon-type protease